MKKVLLISLLLLFGLSIPLISQDNETINTKKEQVTEAEDPIELKSEDRQEIKKMFGVHAQIWIYSVLGIIVLFSVLFHIIYPWQGKKNPYMDQTFGLPPGVFRGLLTLSLIYFIISLEVYNFMFPNYLKQFSRDLITGFEIMLGFYFGGKALQHLSETDRKKAEKASEATETAINAKKEIEKLNTDNPLHDPDAAG